jgi:hypothetical protein
MVVSRELWQAAGFSPPRGNLLRRLAGEVDSFPTSCMCHCGAQRSTWGFTPETVRKHLLPDPRFGHPFFHLQL